MRTFLRILGFARPVGLLLPQFVIYTILATIFSVVNFTILKPLLDILFNQVAEQDKVTSFPEFSLTIDYFRDIFYYQFTKIIEESGKLSALYYVCMVIVASVFLANLFRYLSAVIMARVRINVVQNLRNAAFYRISQFDLGYFTEKRKGDIISRVTTDVQEVELSVVSTLKVLFKEPLMIIGFFIALFNISVGLSLYTLIMIPVAGTIISFIAKKLKKSAMRSQESLGRINNVLDESITGIRIIKAFTATRYIIEKFRAEVREYSRHNFKIATRINLASPISEFLGVAVLSLILVIGGSMVLNEESTLSASEFISFLILFSQVLTPAKAISNSFSNINRGLASGERIFQLMDSKPQILEKKDALEIKELKHEIRFDKVDFAYGDTPVLTGIGLEIPRGRITALVGPSGGGKSTLVDLIPRFYDPVAGNIYLDGHNLKDYKIESLRRMMGIVTQESILFNDTVANNIAFGKPDATPEEIREAARVANAHDFIEKLEDGYATLIGERGTKLSGGQRQRVSIARAVLKNPPILILDEATSALDSESEKLVQDAIYKLMQNRTAIVIAHRLSTIQHADKIVVIRDGQIIQQGTHSSLLSEGGLYKKLTEMQSF